ncbi:hypothetical protein DXG01_006503 [Tephrocybe rancida]|nr:hypothetical protein DXG01_006503 [Tephrocybe rancida]
MGLLDRNEYRVAELNLVVEKCLELRDDKGALKQYFNNHQAMAAAIEEHGHHLQVWYDAKLLKRPSHLTELTQGYSS